MQIKVLFLLVVNSFVMADHRREVTNAQVKPASQVFGELMCHQEHPLFQKSFAEDFELDVVEDMVYAGIKLENK